MHIDFKLKAKKNIRKQKKQEYTVTIYSTFLFSFLCLFGFQDSFFFGKNLKRYSLTFLILSSKTFGF